MSPSTSPPQNPQEVAGPSYYLGGSVLVALATLCITYNSPLALILGILFVASYLLLYRVDQHSGNFWAFRLMAYTAVAALGHAPVGAQNYSFDSGAFATTGLIAGTEIVIQAWRLRNNRLRYEPMVILLSGVVFLVAANSFAYHIWILSPLYMLFTLLALGDLRPRKHGFLLSATLRNIGFLFVAVALGAISHQFIWGHRGSIMAMGVRLLVNHSSQITSAGIGDNSILSSGSYSAAHSTDRIFRITGPLLDPHLRVATFSQYDHGIWGPRISSRILNSALDAQTKATALGPYTEITVLVNNGGIVVFPLHALALVPGLGSSFDWVQAKGPIRTDDPAPYTYHFSETDLPPTAGEIRANAYPLSQALSGHDGRKMRKECLEVPDNIDRRVWEMDKKIVQGQTTPAAKTQAITNFLLKNYRYALNYSRDPGDPISNFLLKKKPAHCQYFASSAVMLLRMAGIPARYVTGYYAHEETAPGQLVVRGRDAHAWAEAYLDGTGWQVVEATPPAGRADPNTAPLPWYQSAFELMQDTLSQVRSWASTRSQFQLGLIFIGAMSLWGVERLRSLRKNPALSGSLPPLELRPAARRFEKALTKKGINPAAGRPWSEITPREWKSAREFITIYNRARFSGDSNDLTLLQAALEQTESDSQVT